MRIPQNARWGRPEGAGTRDKELQGGGVGDSDLTCGYKRDSLTPGEGTQAKGQMGCEQGGGVGRTLEGP